MDGRTERQPIARIECDARNTPDTPEEGLRIRGQVLEPILQRIPHFCPDGHARDHFIRIRERDRWPFVRE